MDNMYDPMASEYKSILNNLREFTNNLTQDNALDALNKAGLIDEKGEPTPPYRNDRESQRFWR